ncbi:MAG: BlaI/MecI/CopY family transcriptional regulator [Pyrinomonadaceae bacterium]|jgi:predicted transcriptional regulator|nr:BlaI/MecI/CopY family transcriptional regulator [Pyrinomonadaceae bacterium]
MKKQPTFTELEILGVLWQRQQATVREVFEIINQERKVTYTTILKMMQVMLEKDFLERDTTNKSHIFTAKLSRDNIIAELLDKVFRGSTIDLVEAILNAKKTSPEEVKEIRKTLKTRKVKKSKTEKAKK